MAQKYEQSSEKPDGSIYRWFRLNEGLRIESNLVEHNVDEAAKALEESVKEMYIEKALMHNSRLVELQDEAEAEEIYFFRDDEDFMKEN